ncbi:MAG: glycosyltransferase [Deltaproteobacteria bacterium]|nr:glycosyltransferase [Deltaproteobacteria bacterium]
MVPEISVLLPMYNAEATLETCLRSLTRQSLASWECVLVDDGSTDRSRALARRIAAGDDRFRLIEARASRARRQLEPRARALPCSDRRAHGRRRLDAPRQTLAAASSAS